MTKKLFVLLALLFIRCDSTDTPVPTEDHIDRFIDIQKLSIQSFDLNDLENSKLSFVIDLVGFDKTKIETVTIHAIIADANPYSPLAWLIQDSTYNAVELRKIAMFPSAIELSIEDIVGPIPNFNKNDLLHGDQFEFYFSIQFIDDEELINPRLSPLCQDDSQSFFERCNFHIDFVCEYNQSEILGIWEVIEDEGDYFIDDNGVEEVEIIPGPGENQVTILNIYNHVNPETGEKDYDIILDIDPTKYNIIKIVSQNAWDCYNFGCRWGTIRVYGRGFVSTCRSQMEFSLQHTGAAFDGGFDSFIIRKKN